MLTGMLSINHKNKTHRGEKMNKPVKIEVRHLSKRYDPMSAQKGLLFSKNINPDKVFDGKEGYVLKDINLCIREGEFHVFLGASGCGKTTLLNIISGLLPKTEGMVLMDGREIEGISPKRGLVFQNADSALFPWLNVEQNVAYALKAKKLPKAEKEERIRKAVELVGLTGHEKKYPEELSGGMRQRLQIARSIASDPEVLIMDEPFGALDAQTRMLLQSELVRIWKQTGKTILFVTHDLNEAVLLGQKISILSSAPDAKVAYAGDVPFSYPRDSEDMDFLQYTAMLHRKLNAAIKIHDREKDDNEIQNVQEAI